MSATEIKGGGLGDVNFAADAAVGFLNPLGAQIDGFLAAAIGPLTASLTASMNASASLSVSLAFSVSDPLAAIKLALEAVVQLQASLQVALALPPISMGFDASSSASLAASLQATLGILDIAVNALLQIKIPALYLAARVVAALETPGASLVKMSSDTLANTGVALQGLFGQGLPQAHVVPLDLIVGYAVVVKDAPGVEASLDFIFRGL